MRTSGIASLSMFCILALFTATRAFALPAADLGLLKPQDKWKVGIVRAPGAPYCAMTNRYDGQVTLAFARSPEGYGSIAMDFRGSFFRPGMEYEVVLQVDDAEARTFVGRAGSGRSVVVQIGMDDGFYLSLKGDGNLRIGLPEMAMTFALREFSASYISLLDCAGKLRHQGPRTAAMPVPPVEKAPLAPVKADAPPKAGVDKMAELGRKQQALMQQLMQQGKTAVLIEEQKRSLPPGAKDGLRERELAARAARLQKERETLQTQLAAVRKSIQENGGAVAENKSLKAELIAKQAQLGKMGKQQAPMAADGGLTAKEMEQKPEGKETVARIDRDDIIWNEASQPPDTGVFSPREKELSRSIFALQKERDALRAQLEMVRQFAEESKSVAGENNRLMAEIASLQSEIAALKSAQASVVEGLQGRLSQAQQQISGLASQLTFMGEQKEQLALELEARDKQANVLQAALSAKDQELLGAEIASTEKDQLLASAQAELAGLKSERAAGFWSPRMQAGGRMAAGTVQPAVHAAPLKGEPSLRFNISAPVTEGHYGSSDDLATVVVQ